MSAPRGSVKAMLREADPGLAVDHSGQRSADPIGLPLGQVAKGCWWSLVDYGGGRLLSFLAFLYVARVLGATSLGVYALCVAVAQSASVFVESGTTIYGIREIAQCRDDEERLVASITYARIITALIVTAIAVPVICLVPALAKYKFPLVAASGYLLSFSLAQDWHYAGRRLFRMIAIANLAKGSALVGSCLLLVRGPRDLTTAVVLYSAAPLVTVAILMWHSCWRLKVNPFGQLNLADIVKRVRGTFAFAGISLGGALYTAAPLYMLAWLGTMEQTGIFSAAQRPIVLAASAALPLSQAFYPFISESYSDRAKFQASQALFQRVIAILTIPILIVAISNAGYIIHLLYGSRYQEAGGAFRIMSLIILLSAMRLTFTHMLIAGHHQNIVAVNAFKAAAATLVMTGVLTHFWGPTGTAWGMALGETVLMGLSMFYARLLFSVPVFPQGAWSIGLAAVAMLIVAVLPGPRLLLIGTSLIVFAAVLLAVDRFARGICVLAVTKFRRFRDRKSKFRVFQHSGE